VFSPPWWQKLASRWDIRSATDTRHIAFAFLVHLSAAFPALGSFCFCRVPKTSRALLSPVLPYTCLALVAPVLRAMLALVLLRLACIAGIAPLLCQTTSIIHSLHFIVLGGTTGHKTVHYLINLHLSLHCCGGLSLRCSSCLHGHCQAIGFHRLMLVGLCPFYAVFNCSSLAYAHDGKRKEEVSCIACAVES
jgi:hypothetical protein